MIPERSRVVKRVMRHIAVRGRDEAGQGDEQVGILPLAINVALVGFEILVAMLQAYVFTILTCLYIRDALELH